MCDIQALQSKVNTAKKTEKIIIEQKLVKTFNGQANALQENSSNEVLLAIYLEDTCPSIIKIANLFQEQVLACEECIQKIPHTKTEKFAELQGQVTMLQETLKTIPEEVFLQLEAKN